jgi:biotin carboxyl carrier protein
MKIQIQLDQKGAEPLVVEMPDHLADGQPFHVTVDGRGYMARWSRVNSVLSLSTLDPSKSANQISPVEYSMVEHSIPVRTMRVTRFTGEAEATCDIECFLPAVGGEKSSSSTSSSIKAAAAKFIPGMGAASNSAENGASKSKRKGKGLRSPILRSQITGKVLSISATEGTVVEEGALLLVIEAMKMENRILAPARVKITSVTVKVGASVSSGDELLRLEAAPSS